MVSAVLPSDRQPKGDHNRRLSLGLSPEEFAEAAGVTVDELRQYERTGPDHKFSTMVAAKVGDALERLEAILPNSQAEGVTNPKVNKEELEDILAATAYPADREETVQALAYQLWERDGRPHGRDQEYWYRAVAINEGSDVADRLVQAPDDDGSI